MPTVSTSPPDPVLETQVLWTKYKTPIALGLVALLVGFAAYGGFNFYTAQRDSSAASLLADAKDAPAFQKVIDQYPHASAAPSAYLLLAAEQRKAQKFAGANATLQAFIAKHPKHELVTTAKMATAANMESSGKPDEALELYRRLPAEHPKSFNAPLALLAQAQLLKQKGQIEQARQACETVMTQYRESYASTEATRFLRTLKPVLSPVATNAPMPPQPVDPTVAPVPAGPVSSPASTP